MNWFEQLASFYGSEDIPLFHWEFYTDVELRLTAQGEFHSAELCRIKTVIPVTESSLTRSFGIAPHPLSDTIKYLSLSTEHNKAYLEQLNSWADSEYTTAELQAVRRYMNTGRLSADLCLSDKYSGMMVRFSVGGVKLWEDEALRSAYVSYVRSQGERKELCCVSGEYDVSSKAHPKRIMGGSSSAKLISFSEKSRIVYSGRFTDSSQVFPIGRECSFKAHAVLKRLLENGRSYGSRRYIAFDSVGNTVPLPFEMLSYSEIIGEVTVMGFAEVTKGRVSITFYRRIRAEDYFERSLGFSGSLKSLLHEERNEGLIAQTIERIMGCILDGRELPADIKERYNV